MDHPDPVDPGGQLSYHLSVTNAGPKTAEDVSLTSKVRSMRFVSATHGGAFDPEASVVTWDLGALDVGEEVAPSLVMQVDLSAMGSIRFQAEVTAALPDPDTSDSREAEATGVTM
jgi:uncharacterized repeat protein (TIGR01451 family)